MHPTNFSTKLHLLSYKLQVTETKKLLGSNEEKVTKYKNGENVLHIENIRVVIVHCNIVNNKCQHASCVLSTKKKKFWSAIKISRRNLIKKKHFVQSFHTLKNR